MQNIAARKSAKRQRQATRLERSPRSCSQDWWKNTTAAVKSGDTIELMGLPPGESSRNETVLVVDDEPLMREFIAEVLRDSGYQVLEASGAMEAQRLTQASQINLLLTDFSMPGTNGLELARWFQGKYPEMKVLIATGALWDLANQVGEQERVAVLPKPFDVAQLSRMVRLALDEAGGKLVATA